MNIYLYKINVYKYIQIYILVTILRHKWHYLYFVKRKTPKSQ